MPDNSDPFADLNRQVGRMVDSMYEGVDAGNFVERLIKADRDREFIEAEKWAKERRRKEQEKQKRYRFLETEQGREWLKTGGETGGDHWLWSETDEAREWRESAKGREWLGSDERRKWLRETNRTYFIKKRLPYIVAKTIFSILYWLGALVLIRKVFAIYIPTPMVRQVIRYSFIAAGIALALTMEFGVVGCIVCGIIGAITGWFARIVAVGGYSLKLSSEDPLKIVIPLLFPLVTLYILVMTKWQL
jgi:hypothetical protein